MNVAVLIKQTFDTEARILLDENGHISQDGVKKIMNPFDEFAVEEAVRIKEAHGGSVQVISLGGAESEEVLRQALAMGADEAVLLNDPAFSSDDAALRAGLLAAYLAQSQFDLLLSGWTSVDTGEAQTAVRLAELLELSQATVVTEISLSGGAAIVRCEADEGCRVLEVRLPALLTVQKGINEPRYPSFMGIMQAKKKPFAAFNAATDFLAGALKKTPVRLEVTSYEIPSRASCKMLTGSIQDVCRSLAQELRPLL